jgi:hypothetical protein
VLALESFGANFSNPNDRLDILVAQFVDGNPLLQRIAIGRSVEIKTIREACSPPDKIASRISSLASFGRLQALQRRAAPADEWAEGYAELIGESIAVERTLNNGKNVEIGLGADVAIVDPRGARLLTTTI